MDPAQQTALNAALDRMWTQFLPQMRERVEILEHAAQAFASGTLSTEDQTAAASAAHKLAGSLGSFGLTRGTELARELEVIYSRDGGPESSLEPQLRSLASHLRWLIENRKQESQA